MTQLEAAKMDEAITLARQHVGIPGHKIHAFLETLRMCGYELRGPKGTAPSADAQDAGAVTAQADPHQSRQVGDRVP